jgi:hypothetical protein
VPRRSDLRRGLHRWGRRGDLHDDNWFDGAIDEAGVWGRVLTDAEIAGLAGGESLLRTVSATMTPNLVGAPYSINAQNGAWVADSLVVAGGQGRVTIRPGVFSGPPSCVCSAAGQGNGNADRPCFSGPTMPTATQFEWFTTDNGGPSSKTVSIVCHGPR